MNVFSQVLVVNKSRGDGCSVTKPNSTFRNKSKNWSREREASSNGVIITIKGVLHPNNFKQIFAHHILLMSNFFFYSMCM